MVTQQTRADSLMQTNKLKRYIQILQMLDKEPNGMTARELSDRLGFEERNATAPRLTELVTRGQVEVIGKRHDFKTNRDVAVYVKVKEENI